MWRRKGKRRDEAVTEVRPSVQREVRVLSPFEAYKKAVPRDVSMHDLKPSNWEAVAANALREVIARLDTA